MAGFALAIDMLVAGLTAHAGNGFFADKEGCELMLESASVAASSRARAPALQCLKTAVLWSDINCIQRGRYGLIKGMRSVTEVETTDRRMRGLHQLLFTRARPMAGPVTACGL
ncbi:MAG: hypothetical protein QOI48_3312 [Solirubrobacteraceae bacterium]|nr:hypothetical protein [Solirubrobacteraceae bacterium]